MNNTNEKATRDSTISRQIWLTFVLLMNMLDFTGQITKAKLMLGFCVGFVLTLVVTFVIALSQLAVPTAEVSFDKAFLGWHLGLPVLGVAVFLPRFLRDIEYRRLDKAGYGLLAPRFFSQKSNTTRTYFVDGKKVDVQKEKSKDEVVRTYRITAPDLGANRVRDNLYVWAKLVRMQFLSYYGLYKIDCGMHVIKDAVDSDLEEKSSP